MKRLSDFDVNIENDAISEVFLWNTFWNDFNPNLSVPINDVIVEEGNIIVNTQNIYLTKQPYIFYKDINECGINFKTKEKV